MKKYNDYKENKSRGFLTKEEFKSIDWTKYKIIVPTEEDRKELMNAFEHFYDSNTDRDLITVNQLIHEYLTPERTGNNDTKNNIIVDEELYNKLK